MNRVPLLLLASLLGLVGCGSTSGQDWLNSPIDGRDAREGALYELPQELPGAQGAQERPRLRQTITLGESYASAESERADAPVSASPVNVTVQTNVPVTVQQTAVYGYGPSQVRPISRPAPPRGSSPATGGDFPAPPNHGPSFPYRSGPVSPWR